MSNSLLAVLLIVSAIILSACSNKVEDYSLTYDSEKGIGIEAKKSDSQIRGNLIEKNDTLYLVLDDNTEVELNSYLVNLDNYKKQRITLVGEYRAGIFFVREIE